MAVAVWRLVLVVLHLMVVVGVLAVETLRSLLWWLFTCPDLGDGSSLGPQPTWSWAPPGPVCTYEVTSAPGALAPGELVMGPSWYPVVLVTVSLITATVLVLTGRPRRRRPDTIAPGVAGERAVDAHPSPPLS